MILNGLMFNDRSDMVRTVLCRILSTHNVIELNVAPQLQTYYVLVLVREFCQCPAV